MVRRQSIPGTCEIHSAPVPPEPPDVTISIHSADEDEDALLDHYCALYSSNIDQKAASAQLWHRRLKLSERKIRRTAKVTRGLDIKKNTCFPQKCLDCAEANQQYCHHVRAAPSPERVRNPGERLLIDIDESDVIGNNGERYTLGIEDEGSAYRVEKITKSKTPITILIIRHVRHVIRRFHPTAMNIHIDRGGELLTNQLKEFCDRHGIRLTYAAVGASNQNATVERGHRAVQEIERAIRVQAGTPDATWPISRRYALQIHNASLKEGREITGEEAWTRRRPNMSRFKVYGCECVVKLKQRGKATTVPRRGIRGIFLGLHPQSKSYLVFVPILDKVIDSPHVTFAEDILPQRSSSESSGNGNVDEVSTAASDDDKGGYYASDDDHEDETIKQTAAEQLVEVTNLLMPEDDTDSLYTPSDDNVDSDEEDEPSSHQLQREPSQFQRESTQCQRESSQFQRESTRPKRTWKPSMRHLESIANEENGDGLRTRTATSFGRSFLLHSKKPMRTETQRQRDATEHILRARHMEAVHTDATVSVLMHLAMPYAQALVTASEAIKNERDKEPDPKSRREALRSPYASEWIQAEVDEMAKMHEHGVVEFVPYEEGMNVIDTKFAYKNKRDKYLRHERFKARWCCRGDQEIVTDDSMDSYAATLRMVSLRTLFAKAAKHKQRVHCVDVKNAYLNSIYPDSAPPIYLRQPKGYVDPARPNHVLRLRKGLYGLRISGRLWADDFSGTLKKLRYERFNYEPCMYRRWSDELQTFTFLAHYVDDVYITGPTDEFIEHAKEELKQYYELSDQGLAEFALGITVEWFSDGVALHQRGYINKLVEDFGLKDAKQTSWQPLPSGIKLERPKEPPDTETAKHLQNLPYRSLVGAMAYLALCTRPDIAHTIGVLSRYLDCYRDEHWQAAIHLLRYLKTTRNRVLLYRYGQTDEEFAYSRAKEKVNPSDENEGVTFADSDFAKCPDTRRSTGGYVIMYNGSAVDWKSKRQGQTTTSTCEAELVQLSLTGRATLWYRRFLNEYNPIQEGQRKRRPTRMYEDNQTTIKLLRRKDKISQRTRHIDISQFWLAEQEDAQEIEIAYVASEENVADIMTKPLPIVTHRYLCKKLGMVDIPSLDQQESEDRNDHAERERNDTR